MVVQRALQLGDVVRFLLPRPPEELVSIYQAADIVAVPSYNESFGLVAVEAQATGTPVVAAKVGGLPLAEAVPMVIFAFIGLVAFSAATLPELLRRTEAALDAFARDDAVQEVLSRALRELGVQRGDRVAAYLPNVPETAVAFLASDDARYISGAIIPVDGGLGLGH